MPSSPLRLPRGQCELPGLPSAKSIERISLPFRLRLDELYDQNRLSRVSNLSWTENSGSNRFKSTPRLSGRSAVHSDQWNGLHATRMSSRMLGAAVPAARKKGVMSDMRHRKNRNSTRILAPPRLNPLCACLEVRTFGTRRSCRPVFGRLCPPEP